jgi:hypothetical protein
LSVYWLLASLTVAATPTAKECAAAYEQGQVDQRASHLVAAREAFVRCAQDLCPKAARSDCARWLEEIEVALPALVFEVIGPDGQRTEHARVFIDGKAVNGAADGRAVTVDPGTREVRVELEGSETWQRDVPVAQGNKAQRVSISFFQGIPAPAAAVETRQVVERPSWQRPLAITLFAVALGGVVSWSVLGLTGLSTENQLRSTCAPDCDRATVAALHRQYVAADVLGIMGALALAAGLVTLLWPPPEVEPGP